MTTKAIPNAVRRAVADRYGATKAGQMVPASCAYCGEPGTVYRHSWGWATFDALELDHVIPRALGGTHDPENITLACRPCNRRKRDHLWAPGDACPTCGTSTIGIQRLQAFGFTPHPCDTCRDRFGALIEVGSS